MKHSQKSLGYTFGFITPVTVGVTTYLLCSQQEAHSSYKQERPPAGGRPVLRLQVRDGNVYVAASSAGVTPTFVSQGDHGQGQEVVRPNLGEEGARVSKIQVKRVTKK